MLTGSLQSGLHSDCVPHGVGASRRWNGKATFRAGI